MFKDYLKYMNQQTGYRACWDPGRKLQLGQIGRLDKNGFFTVGSTLEKENIKPDLSPVTPTTGVVDYTTKGNLTITMKAAGEAPVAGSFLTQTDVGCNITFTSEKAIVFQAAGYKSQELTNMFQVEKLIREKYDNGNWDEDWLIITHLITVDTATIIISNNEKGSLDLKASANVGGSALNLTNASLGLCVAREVGNTYKYIAQNGLTPFYRVMGIKQPWLALFNSQQRAWSFRNWRCRILCLLSWNKRTTESKVRGTVIFVDAEQTQVAAHL